MKKLLVLFVVALLLCVSASALPQWSFEDGIPENFTFSQLDKTVEDGIMIVNSKGTDPYFSIKFTADETVPCSEYKYLAFNYKTDVNSSKGAIFFGSDTKPGPVGTQYLDFDINNDNQWHSYIIDLSVHADWTGNLNLIRIDPYNNFTEQNNDLQFEKIGVFKTAEEARTFLGSDRFADFDGLCWMFDSESSTDDWTFSGITKEFYENVLLCKVLNWDPTMTNKSIPSGYDCSEYKYVAFNMNTVTEFPYGLVFFANTNDNKLADNKYVRFEIVNDGEWNNYIVDMTANANWNGDLTILRLDPQNGATEGTEHMYIGRIGLFKTSEEAQRFLDHQTYPPKSENPDPTWNFHNETDMGAWTVTNGFVDTQFDVPNFISEASNMNMCAVLKSVYNPKMQTFSTQRKYAAIRYNAYIEGDNATSDLGIYFNSDGTLTFDTASYVKAQITADGTYRHLIVDMSENENWTGDIKGLKIVPIENSKKDDSMIISSMGFFETEAQAQAFLDADTSESDFNKIYEGRTDTYKTVILPGTLDYGYKLSEYTLSSATPSGEGEYAAVFYTDNEGNESIVAFSDYNETSGYVRYLASRPGSYSVKRTNAGEFGDIVGHWGEDYIDYISARRLTSGTDVGEFSPDMPVTRGMFITVLGRAFGLDISGYDPESFNAYPDVAPTEYYAPYIEWSAENGILPAIDGKFLPEQPLSRGYMALAINNFIEYSGFELKINNIYAEFDDLSTCSAEVKEAIGNIASSGIVNGIGAGRFDPEGSLTRAEMATVFTRIIKASVGAQYVTRFEKEKFTIGAFGFAAQIQNPEGFRTLSDMNVDFIVSGGSSASYLRLAEEYGLSVFGGGRTHSWWGDNGQNAGTYGDKHPPEAIEAELAKARVSDNIVADYIVDEPSALDYEAINEEFLRYSEVVEGKSFPFINLYPNYGKLYDPANPEALSQLGTTTYQGYVDEYVKHMDLDYISFDNYPYGSEGSFKKYLQNLDEVGAAARDNDLYMWVIIQTGQWEARTPITLEQIKWQMYACMAYGTTSIIHACYSPQWWSEDYSCVSHLGETNPTYYMAQEASTKIRTVGDVFMDYDYLGTYGVGHENGTASNISAQLTSQNQRNASRDGFDGIDGITVTSSAGCLVGCFEKEENRSNKALMLVNCADPFSATKMLTVTATVNVGAGKTAALYENGVKTTVTSDANGNITVSIPQGEGVFVTIG